MNTKRICKQKAAHVGIINLHFGEMRICPIAINDIDSNGILPPRTIARGGRPKKFEHKVRVNWKPEMHQLSALDVVRNVNICEGGEGFNIID
jgi:hypothetical protein